MRLLRRPTRPRSLLDELSPGGVRLPLWGAAGLLLLGAGSWALLRDVPRWNAVWYVAAWYGYLLILDAVLFLRRRRSFVSHERGKFLSMLLWSVPFWLFFEACNLVLRNWYYVFGLRNSVGGRRPDRARLCDGPAGLSLPRGASRSLRRLAADRVPPDSNSCLGAARGGDLRRGLPRVGPPSSSVRLSPDLVRPRGTGGTQLPLRGSLAPARLRRRKLRAGFRGFFWEDSGPE